MSIEVDAIGLRILAALQVEARDVWSKWSPDVQLLVQECAMDAGKLSILALSGKDVSAERAHITAQLANLKVTSQLAASTALWAIVGKVLTAAFTAMTR